MTPSGKAQFSRIEDTTLVCGKGQFVADIKLSDDVGHVAFVRSTHAHAKIVKMDLDAARNSPGVRAVLTYDDIRPLLTSDRIRLAINLPEIRFDVDPFVLVKDEATYVGEPIAMVIADSRHEAEDAAALVEIDYDILPAVLNETEALKPDAPLARLDVPDNLVAQQHILYGDIQKAFAQPALTFSERFNVHKGGGHSMEPRGLLVQFDRNTGMLTVWNSTQMPHRCKSILVDMLGLTEMQVRVITPDVGGGFGPKAVFYPEELAVPAASLLLGMSLRWIEDRLENFLGAVLERDMSWEVEVAADADGRILGIRGQLHHDHGSCTPYGLLVPQNAALNLIGNYTIPALDFKVYWCLTNKVPVAPTRGAGRPQGTFVLERLFDMVAQRLNLDRAEVRRRNLIPAEKMPFSVPLKMRDGTFLTYDSGDYPECQRRALIAADWDGFPARREESAKRGLLRGIGLSNYVELTGRGPFETVSVRVGPSGHIVVATGATTQGQSTKTTLATIVADILRVDIGKVQVICGDTAATPYGGGAFASRQAITAGASATEAAEAVAKKAREVASTLLEVGVDDLELENGEVRVKGSDIKMSLGALARAMQGTLGVPMPGRIPPGLFASAEYQVTGTPHANGTHIVEVEIDPGTWGIQIVRYIVVHDCGRVLNPTVVDGQVTGGVVHGIGEALYEWMRYDDSGQPLTVTYADYLLPTVDTVSPMEIHHMETPSPLNPLGVKGAGEGGTIGAPAAIASAVEDALRPYNVSIRDLPITPAQVHAMIERAQLKKAS
jgi:carbon-monoxide dehydrogenase large subunit